MSPPPPDDGASPAGEAPQEPTATRGPARGIRATVGPCDPSELVSLMRAGDVQALERMTRCYGERLVAVGRRYCRTPEEAEDAVQDALLSAGRNLEGFRGDGSIEGWLVRMVTNACHRMRRGRKNDPHLHVPDEGTLPSTDGSPEAQAFRWEMAEALGDALQSLAPRDRLVLVLSEVEGWTAPEIAEEIGATPGAVRTRLTRIRAKLRERLSTRWAGVLDVGA